VKFSGCPNNAKICFDVTGGVGGINRHDFETYPFSDMVRAAGTWLVATGDAATEAIMVYGLWATKVSTTTAIGCPDGAGPWLRAQEF
jgi:hypothetical protein